MLRNLCGAVVLAVCVLAGAGEAAAQTRADSAAVLLNAAERLRAEGDVAAARAVLDLIARHYAGTPAAAQVGAVLAALRRVREPDRSGRTELIVFGTTYGAWLGVAAPLILESDDPEAFGLGLLLGAPAGFLGARMYADRQRPTEGQARALTFGGAFGTWQGFGWAEVLKPGARTERFCPPPETGEPCIEFEGELETSSRVAYAVVGGLAGIATGAVLARKPISAGTAAAVTLSGMWGTLYGWGIGYLGDAVDEDLLMAALLGGDAALVGAGLLAPRWQMSESRARLISIAGVVGGLAGLGLVLIMTPEEEKVVVGVPLATSAAGLALGAYWTRSYDAAPDVDGRDDSGPGQALLNRGNGRWRLDTPQPALTLQRAGGRPTRAALYLPLVQARF